MYTTRGYRQSSRENRKHSHQGQIIQRKPKVQIDNNPVVLEAYRKFLFGTLPRNLIKSDMRFKETFVCNLADFGLVWNSSNRLPTLQDGFIAFAGLIFDQYTNIGRYAISLECYSPNLNDSNSWYFAHESINIKQTAVCKSIIIDRLGNFSVKQYGTGFLLTANVGATTDETNMTIGYGLQQLAQPVYTLSNPAQMKVDIYYYRFYDGN